MHDRQIVRQHASDMEVSQARLDRLCSQQGVCTQQVRKLLQSAGLVMPCNETCRSAQRHALLALYEATQGSAWAQSDGWSSAATDHCSWYGVTCCPANASSDPLLQVGVRLRWTCRSSAVHACVHAAHAGTAASSAPACRDCHLFAGRNKKHTCKQAMATLAHDLMCTLLNVQGCSEGGVLALGLAQNNLNGTLMDSDASPTFIQDSIIQPLSPSLRAIDFSDNVLHGTLPVAFSLLSHLTELTLDINKVRGPFFSGITLSKVHNFEAGWKPWLCDHSL